MPCRVWIASHCFPVWRPSHALDANNRGRESATHFLLLESIYREPFFIVVQLYPICERGVRSKWCCATHMPLPKPAQFFAALIFVSLVSLAIHFLAAPRVTMQAADATAVKSWRRDPGKAEQSKAGE